MLEMTESYTLDMFPAPLCVLGRFWSVPLWPAGNHFYFPLLTVSVH